MNRINPKSQEQRLQLQKFGKIILIIGVILAAIGFASLFSGTAQFFWCAFLGLPMIIVGLVLLMFGYTGKVSRYVAGETLPVTKDTINYLGKNTKEGVSNFSEAIFSGLKNVEKADLKIEDRLGKLNDLLDKGLIDKEEYNKQRSRILDNI